jgi:hypothetical protein
MTDTQLAWPPNAGQRVRDAARARSEPSVHRHGGPNAGPGRGAGHRDEWLTVDQVCAELNIGRRTFERWRALGIAPRATRPTRNGPLRIKRSWLEEWAEDGAG